MSGFQCVIVQPVFALDSAAPAEAPSTISLPGAGETLLSQAGYWWREGNPKRATESLTKLLASEPNNADALAMLVEISAEQGQGDIAHATLDRLRQLTPDDPRLARLEEVVKRGVIDPDLLAKARAALQAGRSEEAIGLYRQAMHSDVPPPSLAREFYSALGNTDQGLQDAVTGMKKLVIENPGDLRTQLAYAQLLTLQDASREEGITRLIALEGFGPVAKEAATSLQQSLLRLPNDRRSIPYLEAYLKRHPDDAKIQQRLSLAQNSTAPSEASSVIKSTGAGEMLLSQAGYWWREGNPNRAIQPLTKLLASEPDNADALAMLVEISAEQGQGDIAHATLDLLRQRHPDDPRLARLEEVVKRGVIDPELLAKARAALQAGRSEEAIGLYRQAMHSDVPPPSMTREFYSALGNTDQGFQDAVAGMKKLLTEDPANLRVQLAYAELLTVQDASRAEGVTRLAALQDSGPVAEEAATSLHQSLLGLPNDTRSIPYFEAYLKRHPNDAEIRQRLDFVRNPVLTPAVAAANDRLQGFANLKANKLGEAETAFQKALAFDADDADAVGGMGLVRVRQNRIPEARALLSRAAALDLPWQDALKSLDAFGNASTAARDAAMRGYAQVQHLTKQGDTVAAEQQLRKLMKGGGDVGNFVQLGSIQVIGGRLSEAEASFRHALSMAPANKDALSGLADVLVRQGRDAEVTAMLPRLSPAQRQSIEHAQAEKLRVTALATDIPAARSALLRQAVTLDPANPWLRFAYAQALQKQGLGGNARQVMGDVRQVDVNDPQAVQAQLVFAQQTGDDDRAVMLLRRMPPQHWTPQMREQFDSSQLRQQIRQAMAAGNAIAVSSQLQALTGRPDSTGERTTAIVHALIRINDRTAASAVLRDVLRRTATLNSRQSLAYASLLLELGHDQDAKTLVQVTDPTTLSPDLRETRVHLLDGIAIRQSDLLNEQGHADEAMKVLAPRMAESPDQPAIDMARARILQQQGKAPAALSLYKSVLQRDQTDLDARTGAVEAALAAGDYPEAYGLVVKALTMAPTDARSHLMTARLAQSRGYNRIALREYEIARGLHSKQLAQMHDLP